MISEGQMNSDTRLWREIHGVCSEGNVVVGEQHASANFHKRHWARGIAMEVVLDVEGREAYSVSILLRLDEIVDRDRLKFVLHGAWPEVEKRESHAESSIKNPNIGASPGDARAALREELELARAADYVLGPQICAKQQQEQP